MGRVLDLAIFALAIHQNGPGIDVQHRSRVEIGIGLCVPQRTGDDKPLAKPIVKHHAVNISPAADAVDKLLSGFEVSLLAVHINQSSLDRATQPHHTDAHFSHHVFPILLDTPVAMDRHGNDQSHDKRKKKLGTEAHDYFLPRYHLRMESPRKAPA